ncbi:MAG TPA: beta-N-acetylhexosaminidase [Saprospiraceae bacterium]|nr:beta-N-acetylhexosaminidase [Saprospiraceae bacterium]HQU54914.1 beta-N-acetylhexosaminidase [Saprospiraceae bacterium]HRV86320.1 beta-N-acetylhexosaminidase [Saprospiraceae bacterium]
MKKKFSKPLITTIGIALLAIGFVACYAPQEEPTDLAATAFIPKAMSVTATAKSFHLNDKTGIEVQNAELEKLGNDLAGKIKAATGLDPVVQVKEESPSYRTIYLSLQPEAELGEEGYQLTIEPERIVLSANRPVGIYYGIQTLLQTLPAPGGPAHPGPFIVPTGTIRDMPRFAYRGVMLDVARHFFSVDEVKQYIDYLAEQKINYLHLHLTDDQGWRIEIKSWPDLTKIGGSLEVGGGPGGFYTQEEFKDLIRYAGDRFITIVPEIDMPGHTNAALASYADLNCDGKARELYTGTEVGFSSLCVPKEITYQFVDDVVREIADLKPGPYFHLGGDESHSTGLPDFIKFVERVRGIVRSHGFIDIGWDETAQTALDDQSIIQLWASADFARKAVEHGTKLIMSPATKTYLDMQYDSLTPLGLHWAAYIEVDQAYEWDPTTLFPGIGAENILGLEFPLWTETVTDLKDLEFMVYPRLLGLSEISWSPKEGRSWAEYKDRLASYIPRLDAQGINYYKSPKVDWPE